VYCQRHVERRIALAESLQRDLGNPIRLQHHEVWEVDEFEARLRLGKKYIMGPSGLPIATQNLSHEEAQWMLNEQLLVMSDHAYAITRYGYVTDEEGVIKRFTFRLAQLLLFNVISDLEDLDAAIEIMILKARQLGMTTVVELLIMFRIIFSNGVNAIIASADRQKSKMMGKKLLMGYDMLPIWLRPQYTSRVETENGELTFGQLNSGVYVQHGNQMSGIARGSTPTLYHLSECASFTNAKEQIEASLFKAVHASPSIFGILESTGEGDEGWWAETWHYSKANWASRTCRLCPIFFPWVIGRDLYPKPAWLKMRPVPEAFYEHRLPDTQEHVARVEAYIANTPLLRKQLGPGWRMPIEQQWFWEVGHEEHKAKGMEGIWFQEMAGDDIEALQRSQESVFGHDVMVEVENAAIPTFQAFGLTGQSIEDLHEPPTEDIDYGTSSAPRTREIVTYNSNRGDSYRWELIPLHHDMAFVESLKTKPDAFREYANGKLMVFHPPTPGIDYSIGVDTSNGMGEDSTVICVTAPASRRGQPDTQAAEFRSAYVSHVEAYAFIMCIAAYYSKFMEDSTPHRNPLVGVEQIASVGDVAQVQMRKMGYTRFPSFIRYDGKDLKKQKSRKIGWYTNVWSRPILVDSFVHSVKNGWYVVNSPWLIQEMHHFEVHYTASGKEKKEHEEGEHDDGLFAAAISEIIVNDLKSMTERSKKRFGAAENQALPPINVEPYRGHTFSTKIGGSRDITMSEIIYSSTAELDRWR
jgi:hypothetical protein